MLYEALAGHNPVRAGSPAATARRVGTVLPPLKRSRKDLPPELSAAIDRALRPKPDERGTLEELARRAAGRRSRRSPTRAGPSPTTRSSRPRRSRAASPASPPASPRAALAAAALDYAQQPLLPRCARRAGRRGRSRASAGWSAATAVARRPLGRAPRRHGAARRRRARARPAPALPPRHDLVAPGRSRRCWASRRSPAPTRRSPAARPPGRPAPRSARSAPGGGCSTASASQELQPIVEQAARDGGLLTAAVWAAAATLLPWIVRGRWLALDVVAASAWAAALGAATAAAHRGPARRSWCSRASSRASSRSWSHTSDGSGWWSRDAGPDTVHPQSWPSHPRSRA